MRYSIIFCNVENLIIFQGFIVKLSLDKQNEDSYGVCNTATVFQHMKFFENYTVLTSFLKIFF